MRADRRQFIRIRVRLTTFLKLPKTGKVQRALTRDLGTHGLCLITEERFDVGTPLELEIKLPDRQAPIVCTARVVRSNPLGPQDKDDHPSMTAETGVDFVTIDPKDAVALTQFAKLNALPDERGVGS